MGNIIAWDYQQRWMPKEMYKHEGEEYSPEQRIQLLLTNKAHIGVILTFIGGTTQEVYGKDSRPLLRYLLAQYIDPRPHAEPDPALDAWLKMVDE